MTMNDLKMKMTFLYYFQGFEIILSFLLFGLSCPVTFRAELDRAHNCVEFRQFQIVHVKNYIFKLFGVS